MNEHSLPDGIAEYEGASGNLVYLNISDQYQFFSPISLADMSSLLNEFRQAQIQWLSAYFCEEISDKNEAGHPIVRGLQGRWRHLLVVNSSARDTLTSV